MRLESVCTGKTRHLDIRGQSVKTAFLKSAVSGPVQVTLDGLQGNEVAVHTDALYAISLQHYQHWAERLDVDVVDWAPGFFAENLRIDGLDETALNVGDVLSVGDEVRLSVSGPRVPCFKLCWQLDQPDTFIREFALSGKSGVYFNVERPGIIKAGDEIKIESKATGTVGLLELSEYVFEKRTIDEDILRHILELPGLSETSALLLRNKLYQILDQQRTSGDRWQGWREFNVDHVVEETDEIKSFFLTPTDTKLLAPFRAGQFITVQLPIKNIESAIRVWSLSDYDNEPEQYRLSIKREPQSTGGSAFMHEDVTVGSRLKLKPPMGRFVLDRSSFKPVLLIAGGIGITPLLSMAKAHLERGAKAPPLYFIHCCRNRAAQPFREELDQLSANKGVNVQHVYDQPQIDDLLGTDYQIQGFLSLEHIEAFMQDCHIIHGGKRIDMPWFESDIYLCGPPVFQSQLVDSLIEAGANENRLFTESFESSIDDVRHVPIEKAEVVFSTSGKSVIWRSDEDKTLLELAEAAGLDPDNACRMGVCQSCSTILQEGKIHYKYSLTHPSVEGQVLLCSAVPGSERIVLKL